MSKKMKKIKLTGIILMSLLIMPSKVVGQDTVNDSSDDNLSTIGIEEQLEGFNLNQSIQDVDEYFKSLGNDVTEGLKVIQQFDRDLESYYGEYEKLINSNSSEVCLSINVTSGECIATSNDEINNELTLMFLESQLGIDRETVSFLGNFFDVDVANGKIKTKDVKTVAGNLLGINLKGKECPFILRTIAGSCNKDTRLPILVTRDTGEARDSNRGSGNYRSLSQPTHLLMSENEEEEGIEPNTKTQLANLYDREIARSVAYGFVEQRGQKWLGDNLLENYLLADENSKIYQQIYKLTGDSMNLSVTQDVMKVNNLLLERTSHMALNQSIINTKNQASLMSIQQENAYMMQLQANISDTLDRQFMTEQKQAEAVAIESITQALYIPGFTYLYE